MSEAREFWIVPYSGFVTDKEDYAEFLSGRRNFEVIHVREVTDESTGCGACGDSCKDRGSCRLDDESPKNGPVAWMTEDPAMLFFDKTEATTYCGEGESPIALYKRPQPDHAAALADALEEFITAGDSCTTTDDDWSAMLRFGKAVDAARSAIAAYRASQKGGA